MDTSSVKTSQAAMHDGLLAVGWTRLEKDHPRRYVSRASKSYLTWEKDGARIATSGTVSLWFENGGVTIYHGDPDDVVIEALLVDPGQRRQGRASDALQTLSDLADQAGITLYLEPALLEDSAMTREQLTSFYRRHGFTPQDANGRVLVRKPRAAQEEAA